MSSSVCLKWPFGWCTDPGKYGEPNRLPLRECHHAVAHWQDLCSDFLFLPEWLCFWSRKSCLQMVQTSSGCPWEWEPTTLWMSGSLMTKAKKTKMKFKVKVVPLITFLRIQRGGKGERERGKRESKLAYHTNASQTIYSKYDKYKIWTRVAAFILYIKFKNKSYNKWNAYMHWEFIFITSSRSKQKLNATPGLEHRNESRWAHVSFFPKLTIDTSAVRWLTFLQFQVPH